MSINKIKQLLQNDLSIAGKATKSPWHTKGKDLVICHKGEPIMSFSYCYPNNNEFIAHSRNVFESRVKALEIAIRDMDSISRNGCCEPCQEAKLWVLNSLKEIAKELGIE